MNDETNTTFCPICQSVIRDPGLSNCPTCGSALGRAAQETPPPVPAEEEDTQEEETEREDGSYWGPTPAGIPVRETADWPPVRPEETRTSIDTPAAPTSTVESRLTPLTPRPFREPSQPAPPPAAESPGEVVGRIAVIFGVVGFGLGIGALLFLWINGFFKSLEDQNVGEAVLGGVAVAVVLVFAFLVGVVCAAFSGIQAASIARTKRAAATLGAVAGIAGHLALIVALGVILLIGFGFRPDGAGAQPTAAPTQIPQPTQEGVPAGEGGPAQPDCETLFGAGSPVCAQAGEGSVGQVQPAPSGDTADEVTVGGLSKLALGLIPAALVGGLTAIVWFPRSRRRSQL